MKGMARARTAMSKANLMQKVSPRTSVAHRAALHSSPIPSELESFVTRMNSKIETYVSAVRQIKPPVAAKAHPNMTTPRIIEMKLRTTKN